MKFLYVKTLKGGMLCKSCHRKRRELKKGGIVFTERNVDRFEDPPRDWDMVDVEALAQLAFQGGDPPVLESALCLGAEPSAAVVRCQRYDEV